MGESRKYDITVTVRTQYLPEQSDETAARFVFAYHITIVNTGTETAQLLTRHWLITEADGKVQEVRGQGVVGEQPTLKPNEAFEYTSGVALGSPVGTMHGSYHFLAANGYSFDAEVEQFVLSVPRILH
ncbi:Co2+/Mg2+ efflux protein ApaG [Chitinimonas sp. BJB300]|uniref:Co2+/Mg2+ efflux protein ApaG n=1 Tax=Chitinimonas sp. BJB300 TaxID=1559339 RepID=UPI000C120CC7|nr:Co2+/Mg2+ efflux protein ApaG [Chitinimonas sp. BJB300]PHV13135.1 Co2+/Mg2+ efflux protein ApaG [Chitinimonas sp. BJB300]TSJ84732.1 Co2+/Mg2+ efflux protein ApaG [Chitinimonas sp. BJB300]